MQLKLAEYNLETGKFEGFLELGKGFGYFGESILLYDDAFDEDGLTSSEYDKFRNSPILDRVNMCVSIAQNEGFSTLVYPIKKDEKDPLNRFNGLFDGRTYGAGRFVLISQSQQDSTKFEDNFYRTFKNELVVWQHSIHQCEYSYHSISHDTIYSNIHQNPELWEKIV